MLSFFHLELRDVQPFPGSKSKLFVENEIGTSVEMLLWYGRVRPLSLSKLGYRTFHHRLWSLTTIH